MALLVHGITDDARRLTGHHHVQAGDLAAVYSALDGDIETRFEDPEQVAQLALSHHDILVACLDKTNILPFRLGTVCADEAGIIALLKRDGTRFGDDLSRLSGMVEIGVQAFGTKSPELSCSTHQKITGRAYLQSRSKAASSRQADRDQQLGFLNKMMAEVAPHSEENLILPARKQADTSTAPRLFDGAFLVARMKVQGFLEALQPFNGQAEAHGLTLTHNGPWPAYNFLNPSKCEA